MPTSFTPPNPDFADRIRRSFSRQGFMIHLGARLGAVEPGMVEIQVPFSPDLTQQHGFFHAGVVGTLADNSGGYAAFTLLPVTSTILTVEYKLNLLSPAKGEMLMARGQVLKAGQRLTVCKSQVFARNNGQDKLCAHCLMTLMPLPGRPDHPGE